MFLNTFSLNAFPTMSSERKETHGLPLLAVAYNLCGAHEDSQEWQSYKRCARHGKSFASELIQRLFTARSSSVRAIRGQMRPNTSQTRPAAITISISKRSAFASGAASNAGH